MYDIKISDPHFLPHRGCQLTLQVSPGESVVITGENGIGKTSLLRRIRKILYNFSYIEQHPLDNFYERKIAVTKNIIEAQGQKLNKLRFERLWRDFSFEDKENSITTQLSGGEAQALKLCLGLAKETGLYLLDEPSQYLDHSKKQVLLTHLEKLLMEGKSLVVVEHDLTWIPKNWRKFKLKEVNGVIHLEQF